MARVWIAVDGPPRMRRAAGFALFAGLAISLLAKGPVALVLTLPADQRVDAVDEVLARRVDARAVVAGTLLAAPAVVPWYWAAERATPGFLDYFLVGEHWKRFVEPGWKGDLYGAAHRRPHGEIWLFWIVAALPWSPAAIAWLARAALYRRDALRALARDPWQSYLLLWAVAPMLFFTESGNVLATYVLPGLPAFALLFAALSGPARDGARTLRTPVVVAIVAGLIAPVLGVGVMAVRHDRFETALSHEALVRTFEAQRAHAGERLFYFEQAPQSAMFYSRGKALVLRKLSDLDPYLADTHADFFVMHGHDLEALPAEVRARLVPLGDFGEYHLLREAPR